MMTRLRQLPPPFQMMILGWVRYGLKPHPSNTAAFV
jgi:hypothetical protein